MNKKTKDYFNKDPISNIKQAIILSQTTKLDSAVYFYITYDGKLKACDNNYNTFLITITKEDPIQEE